jgi:RNA polymerase sigma factor (sigma-70 family)
LNAIKQTKEMQNMENIIVADWLNAEKYIAGLAGKAYSSREVAADIVSAAKVQCLNKYDETKGMTVKSFMTFCYRQARQAWEIANNALHVPTSTGIRLNKLGRLAELPAPVISLNSPSIGTGGDDEACELQDTVSIEQFTPAQVCAINDDNARLFNARQTLTARENRVLNLRFDDGVTLQVAGNILGVSCERVRQIEEKAKAKLRAKLRD